MLVGPSPLPRTDLLAAFGATLLLLLLLGLVSSTGGIQRFAPARASTSITPLFAEAEPPLAFEPNAGRGEGTIDFAARTEGGVAYVGKRGLVLTRAHEAIGLSPIGADLSRPAGLGRFEGVVNDLRGADPAGWTTSIPTFARVRYEDAWPGIDLQFHGTGGALEYDFIAAPGSDPSVLSVRVRSAEGLGLTAAGDLRISDGDAVFVQQAPVAFQPGPAGARDPVEARFRLDGDLVSFALGAYDEDRPLVIDPVALSYSTYLGGSEDDAGLGIAVDAFGSAYLAGQTASPDFDTKNPLQGDAGELDAFIAKLTPAGDELVYSTYLGGSGPDLATDVAVSGGSAYVTGRTSSTDFPRVGGIEGNEKAADAFVAKLTPTGAALDYSTYLGGRDAEQANAIAVDPAGAAYLTGWTASRNFNVLDPVEDNGGGIDVFVSKLNPGGDALAYSTYLGGNGDDVAEDIALDGKTAVITGSTLSPNFTTTGALDVYAPGDTDAFATKLTESGSATVFSTYLSGADGDEGTAVAIDITGAIYIAGSTRSTDFDVIGEYENNSPARDGFVTKLGSEGAPRIYSTYLGGSGGDEITGIAVDVTGSAYVTGTTASSDFDLSAPIEGHSGGDDVFVTKLSPLGSGLGYSTLLGGAGDDVAGGIAIDPHYSVYVTGRTASGDFDVASPIEGDRDAIDAFVLELDDTAPQTRVTKAPRETIRTRKRRVRVTIRFKSDEPAVGFRCKRDQRARRPCSSPAKFKLGRGKHRILIRAIDNAGHGDPTPARVRVNVVAR